ncbi:protein of unknown function [Pseudodesulfovibrio piezophilus C1TLV30]|uniref:Uncharacterized protein n=1 Tax=Pseudodesulfovibrio piezophilus (strain DSM 21447 / JCM 15486 / C1TLV30) TaxID=1322246 RepID=M1WMH3_PSEP2|nr:protein of unknown function [Pseudodesulfovibrio piezophilus C1TLV30]
MDGQTRLSQKIASNQRIIINKKSNFHMPSRKSFTLELEKKKN